MWNEAYCPICAKEMKVANGEVGDVLYVLRCPTPLKIPDNVRIRAPSIVAQNVMSSHFEIEVRDGKTFYENLKLWPYHIVSYEDETNFYTIDNMLRARFIVAIPYMEIPWDNLDKLITKIKTYTIFS